MPRVFLKSAREKPAEVKTNQWYDGLFPDMRTKLNLFGRVGWPDQCYWIPGGRPFLIEFKAEGEEPRKIQEYVHGQLKKNGYDVEVHHDAKEAIAAIKRRVTAGAEQELSIAREVAQAAARRAEDSLERFKEGVAEIGRLIDADKQAGTAAGKPAKPAHKRRAA